MTRSLKNTKFDFMILKRLSNRITKHKAPCYHPSGDRMATRRLARRWITVLFSGDRWEYKTHGEKKGARIALKRISGIAIWGLVCTSCPALSPMPVGFVRQLVFIAVVIPQKRRGNHTNPSCCNGRARQDEEMRSPTSRIELICFPFLPVLLQGRGGESGTTKLRDGSPIGRGIR